MHKMCSGDLKSAVIKG